MRIEKVSENPQFERRGPVLLNSDKAALENYKKQKKLSRRLLEIEKRLEAVERVLLSNGITEDKS